MGGKDEEGGDEHAPGAVVAVEVDAVARGLGRTDAGGGVAEELRLLVGVRRRGEREAGCPRTHTHTHTHTRERDTRMSAHTHRDEKKGK